MYPLFRLAIAQDCHEMWSKEHKRLTRRGWSENEIQAHFKEREIIEYQRYNQVTGKIYIYKKEYYRFNMIFYNKTTLILFECLF